MPEGNRTAWLLPIYSAVATASAICFAFLFLTRPNAGELGAIKVLVNDDEGKVGNQLTVTVGEAPFVQREIVSPGSSLTGSVLFPHPFRLPPHIKLIPTGKRNYDVNEITEYGFIWTPRATAEDYRDGLRQDSSNLELLMGKGLVSAAALGNLKPGLVFEDFTWEAKGIRMPIYALSKTFEQKGSFYTIVQQQGIVPFPIPYSSPPNVELSGNARHTTIVAEVTEKFFKWKNVMKDNPFPHNNEGDLSWRAKGIVAAKESK